MYEHPYLIHRVNVLDAERLETELERRRLMLEQPDRFVPRERWTVRIGRLLHRREGRTDAVAPATSPRERRTEAADACVACAPA
ncbi:hypothetical protein [Microbacterium sp.]|uniref:hypothetical protein n=1 Tax=Microbacterium sp. TaxID=51671 RepID=UPI002810D07E|nr:hypothetical protein [Microbacterium sp.]